MQLSLTIVYKYNGNGSLLHERHFSTKGHFCIASLLHGVTFARGDNFARSSLLHAGSFLHGVTFVRRHFLHVKTFARRYICMARILQRALLNYSDRGPEGSLYKLSITIKSQPC